MNNSQTHFLDTFVIHYDYYYSFRISLFWFSKLSEDLPILNHENLLQLTKKRLLGIITAHFLRMLSNNLKFFLQNSNFSCISRTDGKFNILVFIHKYLTTPPLPRNLYSRGWAFLYHFGWLIEFLPPLEVSKIGYCWGLLILQRISWILHTSHTPKHSTYAYFYLQL